MKLMDKNLRRVEALTRALFIDHGARRLHYHE